MPKCADCGQDKPLLHSIDVPGQLTGKALCAKCFNAEVAKQGRPERAKEAS